MKLQAQIGPDTLEVEIRRDGDLTVATVDGREYELTFSEPEPNTFLIRNGSLVYEAVVSPAAGPGEMAVAIRNQEFVVKVIDPKRLRGTSAGAASADGIAEVRAAMPGKIVRVLAELGEQVEKGQGVIVVEAMKMQNELRSPKAGILHEIRSAVGSTVTAGDVLFTVV